ncbi:MAG: GNAT family N-acetyltransferase [Candidatus ainarchaeum sp.]|nr:GNAT family N-acetyltransferase [Candidatus ainarchaeum sp.]
MIRNAKFEDYKQVFGILLSPKLNDFVETGRNASAREMLIEWQNYWRNTLVAEQNNKIVGFARYADHSGKKAHVLELCTLVAKPQLQQKIVLEILLKELGKRHPAKQKIEASAVENNSELLDFYSKSGFEVEGERKKNFLQNGKLLNEKLLAYYLK